MYLLAEALNQLKVDFILKEMSNTIKDSRSDLNAHTPRSFECLFKDMIGAVIGPEER